MMIKVVESCVFEVPIDKIWSIIRDFNGHESWHPAIDVSAIESNQESDEIGCVRAFQLKDGSKLREKLLSLSDQTYEYSYCLLNTPVPLFNYVSQVRLKPITMSQATFCEWRGQFDTPKDRSHELATLVRENIYRAGFEAIRKELQNN